MSDRPVFPIGIVAEILDVHPETIRQWEKAEIIESPQRRSGKRFYSDEDLKRLKFVRKLMLEGLNLPAIRHYLQLYPCWKMHECPGCMRQTHSAGCAKPCWKEEGTYCLVSSDEDLCDGCRLYTDTGECGPNA